MFEATLLDDADLSAATGGQTQGDTHLYRNADGTYSPAKTTPLPSKSGAQSKPSTPSRGLNGHPIRSKGVDRSVTS